MKATLISAALLLTACAGLSDAPPQPAVNANTPTPTQTVRRLYDLVTFGPGTTPDWEEVRSLFLSEAVVVLRTGRDEMSVFSLDGFVDDFNGFIEQADVRTTGFTERILDLKETVYGDIAHVLVRFDSHIPGSERPPSEGLDSFELIRRSGAWKIVSITNERPKAGDPIPAVLFD